jgi:hypothetical protein
MGTRTVRESRRCGPRGWGTIVLLLGIACWIAGCSGDGDGGPGDGGDDGSVDTGPTRFLPLFESGSRLRAVSLGSPGARDDERQLFHWFDTELDTPCTFLRASDGDMRCLPPRGPIASNWVPNMVVYADENCDDVLVHTSTSHIDDCSDVSLSLWWLEHVALPTDGPCDNPPMGFVVRRLAPVDPPAETFLEVGEACEGAVVADGVFHQPGDIVHPEQFVRATRVLRGTAPHLGISELQGEDGSRQVTGIHDFDRDHTCFARDVADAGVRCIGHFAYAEDWWYADDTCTDAPLAYAGRTACGETPPQVGVFMEADPEGGPALTVGLAELGEPVQSGTVYDGSNGCAATDPADILWALLPVLGPIDPTGLPLLQTIEHGESPVQVTCRANDGGVLLELDRRVPFHDVTREQPCAPIRVVGGTYRCLPEYTRITDMRFADAECTQRLLTWEGEDLPDLVAFEQANFCYERYRDEIDDLFVPGPAYEGPVYYWGGVGECLESGDPGEWSYFELGASVLDDFPELVEHTAE